MLGIWILALFLLSAAEGKEVCYERLGCFSDDIPWSGTAERPVHKLPWDPEKIDIHFLLYTRKNPTVFQISAVDASTIAYSNFNASRITRFIVHGFIDNGEENWLSDMCKRMLTVEDVNCICINWNRGAKCHYSYNEKYRYSPADVHIIGHSLGAHAAGEAGRRRPGIGRITGLDPAQPYFQGTSIEVRLDKSDAEFVDIIHTDSAPTIPHLGFGISPAIGHLDFYPNGGKQMPGCGKNPVSQIVDLDGIWEGTRDFVACNHLRSYKYYSDSIIYPDGFLGYPCASYDIFETENCFPCPKEGCPNMGHFADKFKGKIKNDFLKLYLNTGEAKDFALWRYKVTVTLSGKRKVTGYVNIALYGSGGNTRQHQIIKGTLQPDNTYISFIDAEVNIGTVTKVKFLWNNKQLNPTFPKLGAATITVQTGKTFPFLSRHSSSTVQFTTTPTLCLQ
uniref:Triacylglycerol lipase n=1 Tax=Strix occidentalis caurina TaxID=311401 RepID=A0A8D0KRE1_STROC